MTPLTVGLLGLDRTGTSFGLALKEYARSKGTYQFTISGYDTASANEKAAHKMNAIDRIERTPEAAARDAQIILMNLPYDELRKTYRQLRGRLREGVVILDVSPLKTASQQWAKELLEGDVHVIGFTPLPNSRFLDSTGIRAEDASADYFANAPCLIVPAVDSVPEAVDLAYNTAYLIGGKPRFVDPLDYDRMFAQTEQLPRLLGMTLMHHLIQSESWQDMRYFTGSAFALAVHTLDQGHPDALRDQLHENREVLAANLDHLIERLAEVRDLLRQGDKDALEALLTQTSAGYTRWQTARERSDWDKDSVLPAPDNGGMLSMLVGDRLARRMTGKK